MQLGELMQNHRACTVQTKASEFTTMHFLSASHNADVGMTGTDSFSIVWHSAETQLTDGTGRNS